MPSFSATIDYQVNWNRGKELLSNVTRHWYILWFDASGTRGRPIKG